MMRLAALLLAIPFAQGATSYIHVDDGWARAMPAVTTTTVGYLRIMNHGDTDDVLLGARFDGVRVSEVHETTRDGATLSMRHRQSLTIPAGGSVTLAPGGMHLMLIDAQQPLVVGGKLQGVLLFQNAGEVKVVLDLRAQ